MKNLVGIRANIDNFPASKIGEMQQILKLLNETLNIVQELIEEANDLEDEICRIETEIGDCELPEKIKLRKNELQQYFDRVMLIQSQFKQMGSNDHSIESKIEDAMVTGNNLGNQMHASIFKYGAKDFS